MVQLKEGAPLWLQLHAELNDARDVSVVNSSAVSIAGWGEISPTGHENGSRDCVTNEKRFEF